MKSVLFLITLSLFTTLVHGCATRETKGGYVQNAKGNATFTAYSGCSTPACGRVGDGYTAAMSQLSFGAPGGQGAGDACGRCFMVTATEDPYSPWFDASVDGTFKSIVVKVTDLCPYQENESFCQMSRSKPLNQFGASVHFDLCEESGAPAALFPEGRGAMLGHYQEVPCQGWSGNDGPDLWNGACLAGESAGLWPDVACGNVGEAPP